MVEIKENVSLKKYNTFGVDVATRFFSEILTLEELKDVLESDVAKENKVIVLGGGSNILFVNDFDGLVLKINITGKEVIEESAGRVKVRVFSGETWTGFVRWAVSQNYGGAENLAIIPGRVGGAVAQNIAAYGQNISEIIESVDAIVMSTGELKTFTNEECEYEYRDSLFKRNEGEYVVVSAVFNLEKDPQEFELDYHEREGRYDSMVQALEKVAESPFSVEDVMKAVEHMRKARLPSVAEYGTCGSFFRNPIVTIDKYKELASKIPDLQAYPVKDLSYEIKDWERVEGMEYVKIPAGRVLDEMGYINHWEGNVGISPTHALCVVTNRKATGQEIDEFVERIRDRVRTEYGVELKREVVSVR